jgi:hypothetical protein
VTEQQDKRRSVDHPTVVFILSAPYSGSTWLNLVLGSDDWATNVGEYFRPFKMRGHIACRLCEAEGRKECTVFHGIEKVGIEHAFHFAANRTGKDIIIDASKNFEWASSFLGRSDLEAKFVHLIRHPCGFANSFARRVPEKSYSDIIQTWEHLNRNIEDYIRQSGCPGIVTSYEALANNPDITFPPLTSFAGGYWKSKSLEYWNVEHHGLGANGAPSVYLKGRRVKNYSTGDDDFYENIIDRPTAADERWKSTVPNHFKDEAQNNDYYLSLRSRYNMFDFDFD